MGTVNSKEKSLNGICGIAVCSITVQVYYSGGFFQKMCGKPLKTAGKLEKIPVVKGNKVLYNITVV